MFGLGKLGKMGRVGGVRATLASILSKFGSNAHAYLPGIGTISGLPTENFASSTGDTGHASTDGVVGLVLDAMGMVGAELVANGGFDTDTVWDKGASWSIAGGVAVCTGAANYLTQSFFPDADPVGTTYAVTVDVVAVSGTVYVGGGQYSYVPLALGTRTYYLTRSGLTNNIFLIGGGGGTCTLSSVSVKEITGIHATQPTTANKPLLLRGLKNLQTWSKDLSNATWVKSNTSASGIPQKLVESASSGTHVVLGSAATVVSTTYTLAFKLKAAERSYVLIGQDTSGTGYFEFDLAAGAYTAVTSGTYLSRSFATDSDGYRIVTITFSAANIISSGSVFLENRSNSYSYTGDGTSGIFYEGAGLFTGTLTASQILAQGGIPLTTTAAASNPLAGSYSWAFDGSNDSFLTGNLGITNTVTVVIAGVVNSLGTTQAILGEASGGVLFYITTTGAVTLDKVGAATVVATSAGAISALVPFVLTVRLSGGTAVIRLNGVQVATAASALAFAATTGARIGTALDGTSYQFQGSLYIVAPITAGLPDAECLQIERIVGQLAGVSI